MSGELLLGPAGSLSQRRLGAGVRKNFVSLENDLTFTPTLEFALRRLSPGYLLTLSHGF